MHRARFDVITEKRIYNLKGTMIKEGIRIHDPAGERGKKVRRRSKKLFGSFILASYHEEMSKITRILKEYMLQYYAVKKDTLTIDVCCD